MQANYCKQVLFDRTSAILNLTKKKKGLQRASSGVMDQVSWGPVQKSKRDTVLSQNVILYSILNILYSSYNQYADQSSLPSSSLFSFSSSFSLLSSVTLFSSSSALVSSNLNSH